MSHEIIRSLEKIQDQVKQELQNVKTYRAFLALDKAIDEISEIEDIARSLTGIRGQVVDRLNDVREYRALLAVEKSVLDISEVLSVLLSQHCYAPTFSEISVCVLLESSANANRRRVDHFPGSTEQRHCFRVFALLDFPRR